MDQAKRAENAGRMEKDGQSKETDLNTGSVDRETWIEMMNNANSLDSYLKRNKNDKNNKN